MYAASTNSGYAPVSLDYDPNVSNNYLNTFQSVQGAKAKENLFDYKEKDSSAQVPNTTEKKEENKTAVSDERCKELFGSGDLIEAIADLNAYRYKYKPGAEKIDPSATPGKTRVGIIAQELKSNPVTASTVEEDPLSGYLKVDTNQLSLTEMAILTEMAKRIKFLENKLIK